MLKQEDWLETAKRLAVGMTIRVPHYGDRTNRPNLVVSNTAEEYKAFCQSCQKGGRVKKEHVFYTGAASPESTRSILTVPEDAQPVLGSEHELGVARFLVSKGMDMQMLPGVMYSESRKRIVIDTGYGRMGRDITGKAAAKWVTYDGQRFLGSVSPGEVAVVVEDTFSWYKLLWALSEPYTAVCSLGTGQHVPLRLELAKAKAAVFMYDGDKAGQSGAYRGVRGMRALGVPAAAALAPKSLDPKDMHGFDIQRHVEEACKFIT